jgi:uncharacterized protein (DUF305 family)
MVRKLRPLSASRCFGQLFGTFALVLVTLVFSASPAGADAPAPDKATAKFEIDFMQDMIHHHHMAVMMAEMCLEKAVHGDLRALCEEIIAAQSAEIEQLQTWLHHWYGVEHEPMEMKPGHMRMMDRLMALEGADFEIAFLEMMIRHHEQAIREGEKCLRKAYHEELLGLCAAIIETQSAEIAQMRAWLCEWYGECRKQAHMPSLPLLAA